MSLFEVKNITVAFGGVKALNDVSFGVDKGEIFTIIGPNGAGKSTLFNVISRISVSYTHLTLPTTEAV